MKDGTYGHDIGVHDLKQRHRNNDVDVNINVTINNDGEMNFDSAQGNKNEKLNINLVDMARGLRHGQVSGEKGVDGENSGTGNGIGEDGCIDFSGGPMSHAEEPKGIAKERIGDLHDLALARGGDGIQSDEKQSLDETKDFSVGSKEAKLKTTRSSEPAYVDFDHDDLLIAKADGISRVSGGMSHVERS